MNKRKIVIIGFGAIVIYLMTRQAQAKVTPLYLESRNLYSGITDLSTTQEPAQASPITEFFEDIGSFIMSSLTGSSGNTAIKNVNKTLINHPQIHAFLAVIRRGEGTADVGGYNRLFGGDTFNSFTWHPNILVKKNGYSSTAAGAYQALKSTWDETANLMGLRDFSPASQDMFALGRLAYRDAIDDIIAGRFVDALKKTGKEWASLPYSPYGQPVISYQTALNTFRTAGGALGTVV